MKKYALLCGFTYYPSPGWQGFIDAFDSLSEASIRGKSEIEDQYDWWQVVDMEECEIVEGEGEGHTGLYGMFPVNPNKPKEA